MEEKMFQELEMLCRRYGFKYRILGNYIHIISKRDTYLIENIDYGWHKIELFHLNNSGKSGKHSHGKHDNINAVFASILSHDDRENVHIHNTYVLTMRVFNKINNNDALQF